MNPKCNLIVGRSICLESFFISLSTKSTSCFKVWIQANIDNIPNAVLGFKTESTFLIQFKEA